MPELNENNGNGADTVEILKDEWMIRPCADYDDEYSECTAIKARFHQLFIHGLPTDCTQWKRDSDNCYRWADKRDRKAAKELIESERERRVDRLQGHYDNNVWTRRKSPPEDWNKPLPEYLQKEYENTFLNLKSREMKGEYIADTSTSFLDSSSFCSIM